MKHTHKQKTDNKKRNECTPIVLLCMHRLGMQRGTRGSVSRSMDTSEYLMISLH